MIFKTYETEEQQVEALKGWWQENRLPLALGIALGLGGIFGYQTWNSHSNAVASAASTAYESVRQHIEKGESVNAIALAQGLQEEHRNSPYAPLASMSVAQALAADDDYAQASDFLDWVIRYADDAGMRQLARLRRARLLWALEKPDEALALIDTEPTPAFAPLYLELRGDILAANGDRDAAMGAYRSALAAINVSESGNRQSVEGKLNNLKVAGGA